MEEIFDENKYTRVTTILKTYTNYDTVPTCILNAAADRGKRIHECCELYAQNMLFGDIDNDCVDYVQAYIDWFDENVEEVLLTEKRMKCDTLLIQGQVDMVAKIKGLSGITLIDIKSSLLPSKTWELQTAAYQWLTQINAFDVENRLIVQVKRNGSFELFMYPNQNYRKDLSLFKNALELHRYFYS
jgi:hypothetical protein